MKEISQQEFNTLFNAHYESLVRVAYSLVSEQDVAEDVVQEVFIKFWEKRASLNIEKSVHAYLKKAVIFSSIDHLRKAKKLDEHISKHQHTSLQFSLQTPESELLSSENLQAIYQKIEALPEKSKLIFKLNRFEYLPYKDIANKLDMSVKTVEYHMSKALEILRKTVFGTLIISVLENI